jgi:protein SCO1/2
LKQGARGGLAVLATSMGLVACDGGWNPLKPSGGPHFNSVDITGADYGPALKLPDSQGRVRTLADFKGQVVVVFFGYTQCPDVCPTTMAELAEIKRKLGPDGSKLQAIFVSLDPERDTPEVLTQYVQGMDPSFMALRGTVDQTAAVAKAFKVFFQKVPASEGKGYTLDHTAGSFVFDGQGRARLFTRYGMGVEPWLADIRTLLSGA